MILYYLTCGIYILFWYAFVQEDVNTLTGDHKTSGGMVVFLSLITCSIYFMIWMYRQGERIDQLKRSKGIASSNTGVLYLILALLSCGVVSVCLMQNEINKLA